MQISSDPAGMKVYKGHVVLGALPAEVRLMHWRLCVLLTCGSCRVIICRHKCIGLLASWRVVCKVSQSQWMSPLHKFFMFTYFPLLVIDSS